MLIRIILRKTIPRNDDLFKVIKNKPVIILLQIFLNICSKMTLKPQSQPFLQTTHKRVTKITV